MTKREYFTPLNVINKPAKKLTLVIAISLALVFSHQAVSLARW